MITDTIREPDYCTSIIHCVRLTIHPWLQPVQASENTRYGSKGTKISHPTVCVPDESVLTGISYPYHSLSPQTVPLELTDLALLFPPSISVPQSRILPSGLSSAAW